MLLRGSEWRRWDLHVHTPGTALNDEFSNWEEYLRAIEDQSDVKIIGVTDYLSIANYCIMKCYKENGRLSNVDLLLPNIEFRLSPENEARRAVNIHLIISPEDPNHENEIKYSLGRLTFEYGKKYSCLPDQIKALGRAFDPRVADDNVALRVGTTQFKVDFTHFREWYCRESWMQQNSLIAVAAGKDGLSGYRSDGGWAGYREEITRFSQIIFSGRPGEREFWLGRAGPEHLDTLQRLGGPKPCIHGSDAHDLVKLFRPDEDRFCWIKADPTFEGLKQILYEPEARVHIGPTAPNFHDQARVISTVRFASSDGWFDDVEIPLNTGLVSIIGQKGSGKSALAETIAYTAGSWTGNEQGSFLKRAGRHLRNTRVDLRWADGSGSQVRLDGRHSDDQKVRYLSQRFVERLCSDDHIGTELVSEIEAVIFSHIDPTDTLNASSFDELRALRTGGIRAERDRLRGDVMRLIREECALRENVGKLPEKRGRIKTLREERAGLAKQLPKAVSPEEIRIQENLQEKRNALRLAQQAAAQDKQRLQRIADIRLRVNSFRCQMNRFYREIERLLNEAGIPEFEMAAFHPDFRNDTERPLARREAALRESLAQHEGTVEDPAVNTIRWLSAQIEELARRESFDKARQERTKLIQARIAIIDSEIAKIGAEIAQIEGPESKRITAARNERYEAYLAFFKNLQEEQEKLQELYAPVTARLRSASSPQEQELEFSIRWECDLPKWLERGGGLFDQRKVIPYETMEGMASEARRVLVEAWTSGNPQTVRPAMDNFLEEFKKKGELNYLRSSVKYQDVLEWLFEFDHIQLSYGLKYGGIELEKLSPGTKGIVLLILYLGMDVADTRPLIVDQPDENLDNESIYALLTSYFKTAKQKRQILLITHNPNLVVNADSEQVIVATATRRDDGLPHISYHSGALENTSSADGGIRQDVCRILEGGSDAFRKRERRYALR